MSHSDRAKQIIYKRTREMEEKLKMDEYMANLAHNRSNANIFNNKGPKQQQSQYKGKQPQKKLKVIIKSPKRLFQRRGGK